MTYGFDNAMADWWIRKHVTIRWSNNHADSMTFFFSNVLDFSSQSASPSIDKFSIHLYSKLVINDIAPIFNGDDFTFYSFLLECGDDIIKFIYKNKGLQSKYLKDTILDYCNTNQYHKFTNFDELMAWKPPIALSDESVVREWCMEVIRGNDKIVKDYKSGKLNAINSLKGQVMKLAKGKADIAIVSKLLEKELLAC
jgi:Asp-tRNA(Asn)/Glu-tRNA(Gln) amidotransferase B subunit